jgi:hypothetical protein
MRNDEDFSGLEDDAEARALAARLERLDLGARSRVRESLRARLLRKRPRLVSRSALVLALAVATMMLWTRRETSVPARFPRGEAGLPILPGRLESPKKPVIEPVLESEKVDGVFETRPTSTDEIFAKPSLAG